ncbi:MAG: hypothetical protein FJ206_10575 [Gemmatimonadetes bacterium]|nr:hypothetical protein [Gemmatimonadota bacterium]
MLKRYAVAVAGLMIATGAHAQVGISVRAGTLGVGGELSLRPSRYLGLRAGGNYFSTTRSATIEGIAYQITPKLQNGTAIVDLHPFGGSFHLSGGMVWNSNQGAVQAELTGPITIGPQVYQPAEVGELQGTVKYNDRYAPYAGLGFGGRGRVSFLFDLGVVFSGFPQVSLTGGSSLTGTAKTVFDQNVQQEVAEIQAEIESRRYFKYTPVVSFGLRVGF